MTPRTRKAYTVFSGWGAGDLDKSCPAPLKDKNNDAIGAVAGKRWVLSKGGGIGATVKEAFL